MLWENLSRVSHLTQVQHPLERPTSILLLEELQRGQSDGTFRKDLDMRQTALSLVLMAFASFSFRQTLTELLNTDLYTEEGMQARKEHILDLFLSYITRGN